MMDTGGHITNCRNFTVMNGSGSVLPGEAREFVFKFCSDVEGFFMESWVLRVAPKLRRPFKPLYLKGVATLKELNWYGIDACSLYGFSSLQRLLPGS